MGGGLWAAGGVGSGRAQGFDGCLSRSGARTQRRFVEARFGLECCGGCWVVGRVSGWVGGVVLLLGRGGAAQGAALDRKLPAFVFCPGARARRRFMDAGLLVGRWWWVLVGWAVVGGVFS